VPNSSLTIAGHASRDVRLDVIAEGIELSLLRLAIVSCYVRDPDGMRGCLRLDGREEPLRPSSRSTLVDVNLEGPYPNEDRFRAVQVLADPAFAERFRPRVASTTLALAWVPAGRRAAVLTHPLIAAVPGSVGAPGAVDVAKKAVEQFDKCFPRRRTSRSTAEPLLEIGTGEVGYCTETPAARSAVAMGLAGYAAVKSPLCSCQ